MESTTTTTTMFERATRQKLRYESPRGFLTTEDLWDLSLNRGAVNLNDLAKDLNRRLKEVGEEDFVEASKPNAELAELQLKFELVKYVIAVKLQEREAAEQARLKAERKQKILDVLARKQDQELEGATREELEKMLTEV